MRPIRGSRTSSSPACLWRSTSACGPGQALPRPAVELPLRLVLLLLILILPMARLLIQPMPLVRPQLYPLRRERRQNQECRTLRNSPQPAQSWARSLPDLFHPLSAYPIPPWL